MRTFTPAHSKWFFAFSLLAMAVGAIYRHWLGIIVFELLVLSILFGFYVSSVMTEKLRRDIIKTAAYGSFAAAAIAFAQKFPDIGYRSVSLFHNANFYAYICELLIVAMAYAICRYGPAPLYCSAIAADIGGIIASGCRTAWPALFCGIIVVLICFKKYLHLLILSVLGASSGIAVFCLPRLFFPRLNAFTSDKSLRFLIWKTALGFIKSHPLFGQGMLTYFTVSAGRAHDAHAHNLILDMLVNFGIAGTAAAVVFAVFVVCDLIRCLRVNPACAVALGILTATFVHGFTDIPFISIQTGAMFILIFSLSGDCGIHDAPASGMTRPWRA
jgi:O-antigen ligase